MRDSLNHLGSIRATRDSYFPNYEFLGWDFFGIPYSKLALQHKCPRKCDEKWLENRVSLLEKLSTFVKKPASQKSFLMDLLFVWKLRAGWWPRKRKKSELHVEIDYSGQVPLLLLTCLMCQKRKNITRHASPQKEIDLVQKDGCSNGKYVQK